MRAKTLFAICLLCVGFGVNAAADDKQEAQDFVNILGHQALAVITDKNASKGDKRAKLEALFQKNVDIDAIGKFVLGRYWRSASDEQKKQYLTNYKAFLIKHYTSNLSEFSDADFDVTKVTPDDRGGLTVTMRIKRPQADDTIVDYDVRKKAGAFMVYDIIVEGVSMITTQRSEFASVVSQKGLDHLIAELARRSRTDEDDSGQNARR